MRAGDVITVDFGVPIGSAPGFRRPAVVVSASPVLEGEPRTIHVVPITTNVERQWVSDVAVDARGLDQPSVAQCHLLGVVSTERVIGVGDGNIGPAALFAVRDVIADLLDTGVR